MTLPINLTISACPANITPWTDPTLLENVQKVRSVHVDELRAAINKERTRRIQTQTSFEDPTITPDQTYIRKPHVENLRDSIYDSVVEMIECTTGDVANPSWTDDPIVADITKIRNDHILEMRSVVNAMEVVCACDCNYCSCNCNCTCHCCTCDCAHSHRW